jgi:DNA-binding MarR family transcriptional regulator
MIRTSPGFASAGPGQLRAPDFLPSPPSRVDDLGISEHLLIDIALRHVYLHGLCSIHRLAELMKLSPEAAETLFRRLNDQQYFEVRRMTGDDYLFSLSASGKRLAAERAQIVRYAGAAPVSLAEWAAAVRRQAVHIPVTRSRLRESFSDIVMTDELLDALGPAMISQSAIFIYGPSGTGKTTIAERLLRVFDDTVLVPWAVETDGQIITVADPAVHVPVAFPGLDYDRRWCLCRRPFLSVGGELVTGMLDLQKDDSSGVFVAPLQMKASNGILLIDDFGRQLMSPRDLLNRWIVPLDRRVDFLSLGSGKIDIPFELLVVFSTNLEPHELGDEAFLRRVPNKIRVGGIDADGFDTIFQMTAAAADMDYQPGVAARFRELCLRHSPDLRQCFPRDICNAIRAVSLYEGRKPAITFENLERAVHGYFVTEGS